MTYKLDFEKIYKLRGYNTDCLQNLRTHYQNKARDEADAEHKLYTDAISRVLGHNRFAVTNVACMADGILGHVYAWDEKFEDEPKSGVGNRVCIYCGCDDFDD